MSLTQIFSGTDEPINSCSGGGDCTLIKCSYGFSNLRGRRPSMEDYSRASFQKKDHDVIVGLFGVFDGHGGTRVANYVCENLFNNLLENPEFIKDPERAIVEAYHKTDKEFLDIESQEDHEYDAGTTASTAVLVGDRLIVANVGDSRAVICMGGKAVAVSTDHKPDHQDERQRIEEAGGVVVWAGTWRVDGILAVSRAFGDKNLKQYVVAEPAIKEETVTDRLEFLILASDGLWDVLTNQDAINIVRPIVDAEEAAKELTKEAFDRGSMDNITCIVVRFHSKGTMNHKI